jgi:hypothetical protein
MRGKRIACAACGKAPLGLVYDDASHGLRGRLLCWQCYDKWRATSPWGRLLFRLSLLRRRC